MGREVRYDSSQVSGTCGVLVDTQQRRGKGRESAAVIDWDGRDPEAHRSYRPCRGGDRAWR